MDADHRVSHNILEGVKVSVLYDGSGECIICDNLQMDLTNLGAKELLRYDFGHCPIDKVGLWSGVDCRVIWGLCGWYSSCRRMCAPVTM
ncbi:hypothetical protein BLSTO_05545 [Blastocystis sp. subtype 1]